MIPDVARDRILEALEEFDEEVRQRPRWQTWMRGKKRRWAIEYEGRFYPPKHIVEMATGASVRTFRGGRQTNRYLESRGFELARLHDGVGGDSKPALDRRSAAVARQALESLLPDEAHRLAFCRCAANVIRTAHEHSPRAWTVTLFHRGIRLNVWPAMALDVTAKWGVRVQVDPNAVPAEVLARAEAEGQRKRELKGFPGYRLEPGLFAELEEGLTAGCQAYVRAIGGAGTVWSRSHSPGVVDYLREVLGEDLPDSDYEPTTEESQRFTWLELYRELAETLVDPARGPEELLGLLRKMDAEGYTVVPLVDRLPEGFGEIDAVDPFSFFASFNRKIKTTERRRILEWLRDHYELSAPLPSDFGGLPLVNNMSSRFFAWKFEREPDAIDVLWKLARQCVAGVDAIEPEVFDRCLAQRSVGVGKLTIGLFWLSPSEFLPLDGGMRTFLASHGIDATVQNWREYIALLDRVREKWTDFVQLSFESYHEPEPGPDPDQVVWKIAPETGARLWGLWQKEGIASIGWDGLGDLSEADEAEFKERSGRILQANPSWKQSGLNQVWRFRNIPVGATIVANEGTRKVLGIGTVAGGYYYDEAPNEHRHRLLVRWDDVQERAVDRPGWRRTLVRLRPADVEEIRSGDAPDPDGITTEEGLGFSDILSTLDDQGLRFRPTVVGEYLLALQTKRFVILSGISGTGKTRLALGVAQAFGSEVAGDNYALVPVRPDWTDPRGLLGFHNSLLGTYVSTPTLQIVLRAMEEQDAARAEERAPRPFFLILDEMNLARVEHYFSDFLSALESGEPIPLHDEVAIEEGEGEGDAIPRSLRLPKNLYVTGTVNVDESTYMFSPKVLDRAFTLEFDEVDLRGLRSTSDEPGEDDGFGPLALEDFDGRLRGAVKPTIRDWQRLRELESGRLSRVLEDLNDVLAHEHRHFGYRVASEIARFVQIAVEQSGSGRIAAWAALDAALLSKVFVKLHGTQQDLSGLLEGLQSFLSEFRTPANESEAQSSLVPRSDAKLERMAKRLRQQGFVSFVE